MRKLKPDIIKMAFAALFTAIIAIVSQIAVLTPIGVPFTFQTLAVALCGYVLGVKWGLASVTTYIMLGAVGTPVFSGFKGGIQVLFDVTGGFILGFLLLAGACGFAKGRNKAFGKIFFGILGLLLCHLWGVIQLSFVSKIGISEAFITASLPYIIKDLLSVLGAYFISNYIKRYISY